MKRVLLTGATGLIGNCAIQPLIDAGFEVFAVASKKQNAKCEMDIFMSLQGMNRENDEAIQGKKVISNLNLVQTDLLNLSDIKKLFQEVKPDYMLHFAWNTTPGSYLESDLNYKWLESSLEMLKQFKENGGKRAVFAGTCFEYAFKNDPLKEDDELNPTTVYAKCKAELQKQASGFCAANNISFSWGRIFYVYGIGEHEKRLVPTVIKKLANNQPFETSSGDLKRDYMFAEDVADAFVKLLDTNVEDCVNICTGEAITIKGIVSHIAKKMNKENLVKFNEEEETTQPKIIIGDNSRLKKEVKFNPKYTIENGLEKIMENLK